MKCSTRKSTIERYFLLHLFMRKDLAIGAISEDLPLKNYYIRKYARNHSKRIHSGKTFRTSNFLNLPHSFSNKFVKYEVFKDYKR